MILQTPGCYSSRAAPPIQEVVTLKEGKVVGVTGTEGTCERYGRESILKRGVEVSDVLGVVDWGFGPGKSISVGEREREREGKHYIVRILIYVLATAVGRRLIA